MQDITKDNNKNLDLNSKLEDQQTQVAGIKQTQDLSSVEETLTWETLTKEDYTRKKQIEEETRKSEDSKS